MTIGFLGTGRIAAPMVRALARDGYDILVSERNAEVSEALAAQFDTVSVSDNRGVVAGSDVVVLCLLASVARRELPGLPFRAEQKVISVMAEMSLEEIAGMIGDMRELCVAIPMPFVDSGGCPLAVYPESATLVELFGRQNTVIPVRSETAMKPHFAATALTSTLMKELMIVRDWLAEHAGGREAAEKYIVLLESGYLNAMPKDGANRLDEALNDLATEGGLNAQLLRHMVEAGTIEALKAGLDDLLKR
jgi:pyrroline-5-carboxylate reductase